MSKNTKEKINLVGLYREVKKGPIQAMKSSEFTNGHQMAMDMKEKGLFKVYILSDFSIDKIVNRLGKYKEEREKIEATYPKSAIDWVDEKKAEKKKKEEKKPTKSNNQKKSSALKEAPIKKSESSETEVQSVKVV